MSTACVSAGCSQSRSVDVGDGVADIAYCLVLETVSPETPAASPLCFLFCFVSNFILSFVDI